MTQDVGTSDYSAADGAAEDGERMQVVVNDEEQYSVWPAHKTPPVGWRGVGYEGTRAMCLAHIEEIWTDMRPLSVRRQLADGGAD